VATSVTVVEWGEDLVEDLAPSFLEIAISAPPPAAVPPAGELAAGGDEVRTVRVVGWGERWQRAAPAARDALATRDVS